VDAIAGPFKFRTSTVINIITAKIQRKAKTWSNAEPQHFSISTAGFGAGPRQERKHPLGEGLEFRKWFFATETFNRSTGKSGGINGRIVTIPARADAPSG
jgi:hypothetical protein